MPGEWHEKARELRAAGMSYAEIGRRLGIGRSSVCKLFNPNAAEWSRRSNARRNAAKRAWEREHDRGECTVCGAKTGKKKWDRCKRHQHHFDRGWRRRKRIVELWAAGYSLRAIAEDLGTTVNSLGVDMANMRRDGNWDLPYRYNVVGGKRRKQMAA